MNQEDKITLTEIDRENWRFILYKSASHQLFGDFIYSPKSSIHLSILIELSKEEAEIFKLGRKKFLQLCDRIRFNYENYLDRQLEKNNFQLIGRPNYRILSIDLANLKTIEGLHSTFKNKLSFPDLYGMNWDAFWDCITGVVKMPTNLILYNFRSLSELNKEQAGILRRLIIDFNKLDANHQINLDYIDELPEIKSLTNLSSLFAKRPFQYGFRGDKPLWDELETEFLNLEIAETDDELATQIIKTIEKLTENNVLEKDKFFVKKYNEGGMSGGFVSSQFWLKKAIPIILNRFREMKKAGNNR